MDLESANKDIYLFIESWKILKSKEKSIEKSVDWIYCNDDNTTTKNQREMWNITNEIYYKKTNLDCDLEVSSLENNDVYKLERKYKF